MDSLRNHTSAWTEEEDAVLIAAWRRGEPKGQAKVSAELGRTRRAVAARIEKLRELGWLS